MGAKTPGVERVAMLAHTCYLRDARVRREAEALAEKGIEVHAICLAEEGNTPGEREPDHAIVNGVEIHRLPIRRRRGSVLRYLCEYPMTDVIGRLGRARTRYRRVPTLVHVPNTAAII